VLREAFRLLKPGGRFAVSDVVTRGDVPEKIRHDMLLWVGCIAGALQDAEYSAKLAAAGFEMIEIRPTRIYNIEDAREFLGDKGVDVDALAPQVDGKFMSAFVHATKPGLSSKEHGVTRVHDDIFRHRHQSCPRIRGGPARRRRYRDDSWWGAVSDGKDPLCESCPRCWGIAINGPAAPQFQG
jgi:hypothetical protein